MNSRALWLAFALVVAVPSVARAGEQVEGAAFAQSGSGALAFANESSKTGVSMLRLVSADGQVSAAQPIVDGFHDPQVAMGASGDVIVAWLDKSGLYARFQPVGGTLGAVELVAAAPDIFQEVVPLAVDGAGNAFIAYALASEAGGLHEERQAHRTTRRIRGC